MAYRLIRVIILIRVIVILAVLLHTGCNLQGNRQPNNPQAAIPEAQPSVSARCSYRYDGSNALPDPSCTPGATSPAVTQENIHRTICLPGYTTLVRPPTSYTGPLKTQDIRLYGLTGPESNYELDHLVALEVGGSPRDTKNLWPEPGLHNAKDNVENKSKAAICSGAMTLAYVQAAMAADWAALGRQLGVTGI